MNSFSKDHSTKIYLLDHCYQWRIWFFFDLLLGGVAMIASDQVG